MNGIEFLVARADVLSVPMTDAKEDEHKDEHMDPIPLCLEAPEADDLISHNKIMNRVSC